MALHLIKLCVGCDSVEALRRSARRRAARAAAEGWGRESWHLTRMTPRRRAELMDGGSLYWVIRGEVRARQRLIGLAAVRDSEGRAMCRLRLDPEVVRVVPRGHRAFQGWRYLAAADAPADLAAGPAGAGDMPAAMAAELRALGLL